MEIFTAHSSVTYLNTAVAHALLCPCVYIIYIVHRPTYMIYLIPYYTEFFNVLNSQTVVFIQHNDPYLLTITISVL